MCHSVFNILTFVPLYFTKLHSLSFKERNGLDTLGALSFCLINNTKTVVYFTTQKINVLRFISKLGMFTQHRTTMLFLACTCMLPIEKYVLDKHMY